MIKICNICGKKFESLAYMRKYCDVDCRKKARERQIEQRLLKNKKVKLCLKCNKNEPESPRSYYCKDCNKLNLSEQYEKHKLITRKNSVKKYYLVRGDIEFKRKRNERYKIYHEKRRKTDPQFQIAVRLRNLLYQALKKYTQKGKTFSSGKYGIDFNKIIESLKPFPKDIKNWHIDHIIPLSSFNLENPSEIKKAFASKNLQWLIGSENIRKSNKIRTIKKK